MPGEQPSELITLVMLTLFSRVMRKTGKLYTLTLASSLLTVLANVLVVLWTDKTSAFHLWFDIVPQGFGMASSITSTLIVRDPSPPLPHLLITSCRP